MTGLRRLSLGRGLAMLLGVAGCEARREPATVVAERPSITALAVTILGEAKDSRLPSVREAIDHWNREAARLGLRVRLDSGILRSRPIPDDALQAASRAMPWGGLGLLRLRNSLADVPGAVVIVLGRSELISFAATSGTGRLGVIGLRPADRWPLSLPNTARNVVAHELGHVLGLQHNADANTLMCGRPAPCRPAAFSSPSPRFFPLLSKEEERLRQRWR